MVCRQAHTNTNKHTPTHTNRKEHMTPKTNGQEILSYPRFLKEYAVSRPYIDEQRRAGNIAFKKLGNHLRITRAEAESWYNNLPDDTP